MNPAMPILIMPTTICSYDPPTYEFQMKTPNPPPDPLDQPPPEIITAATTTSQVIPKPTADPTTIEGSVAGRTTRRKTSHCVEPMDCADWKKRGSMDFAPPRTFITIVKKAPRKVTNAMDNSWLGQKMIDAGTQANGGIGRNISKEGKTRPLNVLFTAMNRPRGIPITMAAKNPASTRSVLIYQLCQ